MPRVYYALGYINALGYIMPRLYYAFSIIYMFVCEMVYNADNYKIKK